MYVFQKKVVGLIQKEYRIAELIIAQHCRDDDAGIAAIMAELGLSRKKEHTIHTIYATSQTTVFNTMSSSRKLKWVTIDKTMKVYYH